MNYMKNGYIFSIVLLFSIVTFNMTAATGWYQDYIKLNVNETGVAGPTGYKWIDSDPSYGSSLVAGLGNVTSLKLDGADMKYWSDTQDRTGGSFFYEVKSADGVTTYIAATEVIWTHSSLGGNNFQGISSDLNVDLLAGIPAGTACKVTVWAKSWGTGQGDSWLTNGGANYVATFTKASVAITGAAVIADGTSYTTLKAAFDAINTNAAAQTGKNISVKIYDNTTEAALMSISSAGTWTSLTVYPVVTGKTITSSLTSNIITIFGSNVTFDGRVNQTGARDLTIVNTLASTTTPYTFLIQEPTGATGLSNVTVKYCNLTANLTSSGKGNVTITYTGTPTVAISNINIQNNLFTGRCVYTVYAKGVSTTYPTTGLNISNNEFKNCFYLGSAGAAITVDASHSGATISGNSIYDDSAPFSPGTGFGYTGILIAGGGGHTINDNFIGGSAASCSGTLTKVGTSNNSFIGISLTTSGTGSVTSVQNNTIKGFDWSNLAGTNWTAISVAGTNDYNIGTVTGNTIGSATGNSSITYTPGAAASFYGISIATTGTATVSNNTIGSITLASSGAGFVTTFYGIYKSATAGTTTISNNLIGSTSTEGSINASTVIASQNAYGIYCTGTGVNAINNNTVSNITNSTINLGSVRGIYIGTGTTNATTVNSNFIKNLYLPSSTTSSISGISITAGIGTYSNNIISLGVGSTNVATIYGIYDTGAASSNSNIYHNTIYIAGTPASGAQNSYCLYSTASTNIRDIRNNIFFNARSTNGNHFGARYNYNLASVGSLTLDYNNYYATGTNGFLGLVAGGSNSNTLPLFTGYDVHSVAVNPTFANIGGTTATDYLTSTASPLNGATGLGVSADYSNVTRPSTPNIGALELNKWIGTTNSGFATATNWSHGVALPSGWDLIFGDSPTNNCALDQNRSVNNLTNAQSTFKFALNGYQLTVNGALNLSNGAQIDATAASSVVNLTGASAQSIPSGAFVSNSVDGLTVANAAGVSLGSDLTVAQTLTLTSGALNIGANSLTLNGAISITAGSLVGGATSNLTLGGSGASTTLPAVGLNNLTLNRSNGISLGGDVSVGGALTLTSGALTVGANTLTVSGSSIVRTSGSIDASNASSTLAFTNSSALTLPTSLFSTSVNNLSTSGTGGVILGSDLTINNNATISSVSKLTIPAGKDLTVTGTVTNSAGASGLVLNGSASGNASLIHSTSSVPATVQCQMDRGLWKLISSPVSGQTVANFYTTANSDVAVGGAYYAFRNYNEAANQWYGYFTADSIANYGNLIVGKGYTARRATLANAAYPSQDYVVYTGTLQTGTVNATVKRSATNRGWNCIGNPYSAPIAFNSNADATNNFISVNAADLDPSYSAMYAWNDGTQYRTITNAYTASYVPVGSAFMVRVKSGVTSLQFTPAMRKNIPDISFRSSSNVWSGFDILAATSAGTLNASVKLNTDMTDGLDVTYDGGLMRVSSSFALYTRLLEDNGVDFAVQCLTDTFATTKVIPIGFDFTAGGATSFSASNMTLPDNITAALEDRVAGVFTDLTPTSTYQVTLPINTLGTGRFYLHLIPNLATDIHQDKDNSTLTVYSTSGCLNIRGLVGVGANASLYDMKGVLLREFDLKNSAVNKLDVSTMPINLYLLKIQTAKGIITRKVQL
ncbi:MAG: hypothetical protein PHV20_11595 [Bacteroidales bacterium]|nr:hypothetical protein [Bacteroidales bacterium]